MDVGLKEHLSAEVAAGVYRNLSEAFEGAIRYYLDHKNEVASAPVTPIATPIATPTTTHDPIPEETPNAQD